MKNTISFLSGLLLLFSVSGCIIDLDDDDFGSCERGRGGVVEQVLNLPDFDGIDFRMAGEVYLRQGDRQEVVVQGYANLIDRLDLRVRDGIWEIDINGCTRNPDDFVFFITLPDVRYLEISGSGDIISETVLTTNDIDLRIDGSGDLDLALDVDDVFAQLQGSGDIYLEGRGDELLYEVDGSGELRAFGCTFNEVDIEVDGSGDSEVQVVNRLRVRIDGSGDVYYRGNPEIFVTINGSGDLVDAN